MPVVGEVDARRAIRQAEAARDEARGQLVKLQVDMRRAMNDRNSAQKKAKDAQEHIDAARSRHGSVTGPHGSKRPQVPLGGRVRCSL